MNEQPDATPSLPDLNTGKYSFEQVQKLIDRAAWITLFVAPDAKPSGVTRSAAGTQGGISGLRCSEVLHRFDIDVQRPSQDGGMRAANIVGQAAGRLTLRWEVIPYDFEARLNREPPTTYLDPTRAQRFAMQEGTFMFGEGQDGFRSFGTGRTFPTQGEGQPQLVAAAIGNIVEGFGKFKGLEGTYVLCGHIDGDRGFTGAIIIRIVDPEGVLRTPAALPPLKPTREAEPDITYLMMRSQKSGPSMPTTYSLTPDGQVRGLNVPQELRLAHVDFTPEGSAGLRSEIIIGPVIGHEIGFVNTNPTVAGPGSGTADDPFRFQGVGDYVVTDSTGQTVGSFTAQFLEGRTFAMQLAGAPEQIALRFGFFGPMLSGTGWFEGVEGMLFGNTGVGVAPHVFSNLYILRLQDPKGKYRTATTTRTTRGE